MSHLLKIIYKLIMIVMTYFAYTNKKYSNEYTAFNGIFKILK